VSRPADFLAWLRATCGADSVDVVMALDEDVVRLIAEAGPDLGRAVVAGPDARQYRMLCDKLELAASAAAAGVDYPPTVEVRDGVPMGPWPPLPSIIKPRTSVSDSARAPVVSVRTAAERAAAIAHLRASGLDAVVQEQIRGRAWVLHCVRGDDGVHTVAARVETTWPRVVGTSSVSRVTPAPPALAAAAARLLDLVGYRGACCMNLLERDGRYWFHDVNLRLAASVGAAVSAGFEQPALGVRAALGRPVTPPRRVRAITYVPLPGELSALGAALRDRSGESPVALLRRVLRAALGRGYTLDPPLRDPSWLARRLRRPG
jgi:predicted ATP-grasp superfamily ATP-dependent carboligase